MNSGSIYHRLNTRKLDEMGGLNKVMPITGGTSLIASLSIAGMPPFNGFFSKLLIIIACIQSGHPIFALWAIVGSVITLAYYMKMQKYAFFGKLKEGYKTIKESPFFMSVSMIILAILCLASSFLLIPQLRDAVLTPAVEVILNADTYKALVIK